MNDTISRQAAIDAVDHICPVDTDYDCTLLDRVDVRYALSDLPSAQPERETAKFVRWMECKKLSTIFHIRRIANVLSVALNS